MLINLQDLVSRAVVVRGDVVVGTVDCIEITANSVAIILEDDGPEEGGVVIELRKAS